MNERTQEQCRVTFQPQGRSVHVLAGTTLIEAAALAGLTLDTPCGGAGTCGKCRVRVTAGAEQPSALDVQTFREEERQAGWRLACQTRVGGAMVVEVPAASLFASVCRIQEASATGEVEEIEPAVRKVYVELAPPTQEEDAPDLLRLERQIGLFEADVHVLRDLPRTLRDEGFRGTAVLADHRLIDFEAGDTTSRCFGAAFDIGTTTLVGVLLDLRGGEELAVASSINPQVRIGDDVLARILYAEEPGGLADLRKAVVGEVDALIGRLCEAAGVARGCVYEVTFSGNTTMQHLLCGIDPSALGQLPFVPAYARGLLLRASDLGVRVHPRAYAYVMPVIGGFVGGDTVGGILTTRLLASDGPSLLVDVGTNGELVLTHDGRLWAASTAAGPAFEGARISCGMRAGPGAIEKVLFDGDLRVSVIGECKATGLCGTGLIDVAAEMIRAGLVSSAGRLLPPDALPMNVSEVIRRRVRVDPAGKVAFTLVEASESGTGEDITVTQRDVRELQLAAGAIRAGIRILLKQVGLAPEHLTQVVLAGGFGSFIRRRNARQIGLLPPELESHHIHYVGNTSLSGARWVLLSRSARREAETLARRTRHVELSLDPDFQIEFGEAMIFPGPLERV